MLVMQIEGLSKSYGERTLFENLNFSIHDEDKIGLIGVNGAGKSSLLRALSDIEPADSGSIQLPKGIRVEYLSQQPVYDVEATILEQIFKSDSPIIALIRAYEAALSKLEHDAHNELFQKQLHTLSQRMDSENAWEAESQAKTILQKLNITDVEAKMGTLSGGQKKRVALAAALISPCDLLILDEPTNHMDSDTVEWLESFLKGRKGALLMVTHDRYFLDRVVNKTIELENGAIYSYPGNYSYFVEKRLERRALESAMARKRENLYRQELEWIRAGAQARSTKQKARIQRFETLETQRDTSGSEKMEIQVAHSRLGGKIIEATHIGKSFGDLTIVNDFSYTMVREDRIGIVGPSGIGKTTLLKILIGELEPDTGVVDIGTTVKIGYFSQESEALNPEQRAIDYIRDTAEFVTTSDGSKISASQMLERFLFDGDMQHTYISRLSGGEKRRLFLCQILMTSPNILILDEPTNDLDLDTLKVLESYLDDFPGAVVVVSHDRYFLDRTCARIFGFDGSGHVYVHTGNHTDYQVWYANMKAQTPSLNKSNKPTEKTPSTGVKIETSPTGPSNSKKLTFKEIHELKTIDAEVDALEHTLNALEEEIMACTSEYSKLTALTQKKEALEEALLEKLERQEYLHSFD